jgi:multisubunit Na+/H+ antiporter MnhB subunit
MLGLAFTGLLALAGVLVVLLVSFGCRWMIVRLAALPRRDRSRGE